MFIIWLSLFKVLMWILLIKGSSSATLAVILGTVLFVAMLCCVLFIVITLLSICFLRRRIETPTVRRCSSSAIGVSYNNSKSDGLPFDCQVMDGYKICPAFDDTLPPNDHDYSNIPRPPPRPVDFPLSPQKPHAPLSTMPTPTRPLPPIPSTEENVENYYERSPPPLYVNQQCQ